MEVQVLEDRVRIGFYSEDLEKIEAYERIIHKKFPHHGGIDYEELTKELEDIKKSPHSSMRLGILSHWLIIYNGVTPKIISDLRAAGHDIKRFQWDGDNILMTKAHLMHTISTDEKAGHDIKHILGDPGDSIEGRIKVIEYLIDTGVFDLEQENEAGERLIHSLAGSKYCNHILRRLVGSGMINPNSRARRLGPNLSAIDYAESTGNTEGAAIILESPAWNGSKK